MMRVAYVSADHGVPIFGRKGCSVHAQGVLGSLLRQGFAVELFSTSLTGEPPAPLRELRLHPLAPPPKGEPGARERTALAGNAPLRAELQQAGLFDLVYERYSLWSYGAMEWARAEGVPGVLEVNAPLIEEQARYRVLVDRGAAEEAAARVFAAAMLLVGVSEEVASWVESFPAARGKVHVVSNGIHPERFAPGTAPALPAPGRFTVGFVGTLKAWHGLSVLVEAFARLHARQPDTRLLIVGDGPERANLEAQLGDHGLAPAAVFTGAVAPEVVPAFLASMDVAVAPYPALEPFYFSPLKVYEYMAAGLPVVASAVGQLRTLIQPGATGVLVAPGRADELAAALHGLKRDPGQRARLGAQARAMVLQRHTWDAVVRRILSLAGVVSGHPVAAPAGSSTSL